MATDARTPLSAECSRVQSDVGRLATACARQGQEAAARRCRMGVQGDVVSAADHFGRRRRTCPRGGALKPCDGRIIGAVSGTIRRPQAQDPIELLGDKTMKFALAQLASALLAIDNAEAASLDMTAAEAMMKKDGCAACHAVDKKIIGPSYQEVAAKYKGDKDAPAKLAKNAKEGGSGAWGQIPMPPNATTSDADVKALVDWILTLKK